MNRAWEKYSTNSKRASIAINSVSTCSWFTNKVCAMVFSRCNRSFSQRQVSFSERWVLIRSAFIDRHLYADLVSEWRCSGEKQAVPDSDRRAESRRSFPRTRSIGDATVRAALPSASSSAWSGADRCAGRPVEIHEESQRKDSTQSRRCSDENGWLDNTDPFEKHASINAPHRRKSS